MIPTQHTRARVAPRVSVGMPVYNGLPHACEALRALLSQTFRDFEVIVADNASSDGTIEALEKVACGDERVRFLRAHRNNGLPWNFNRPLEVAVGELFMWAASDDRADPEHLRLCVEALDLHPQAVLAFGRVELIDEAGSRVGRRDDEGLNVLDVPPSSRMHEFLGRRVYQVIGYGGVIRTSVLRSLGGLPPIHGGDLALAGRLAMLGPWVQVLETTYFERRHERQAHNVQWGDVREQMRVFKPDWNGRVAFPQWRLSVGLFSAVLRSRATIGEKARALVPVGRWTLSNGRLLYFDVKRNLVMLTRGRFPSPYDTPAAHGTRDS